MSESCLFPLLCLLRVEVQWLIPFFVNLLLSSCTKAKIIIYILFFICLVPGCQGGFLFETGNIFEPWKEGNLFFPFAK